VRAEQAQGSAFGLAQGCACGGVLDFSGQTLRESRVWTLCACEQELEALLVCA
jgi:hypothetical protein